MSVETGLSGSGGPVEVIEVGSQQHERGQVTAVKILGALPLVDRGTLRWLVIAVDADDPMSTKMKPITANEPWAPQLVNAIRSWFGTFAIYNGVVLDLVTQETAIGVIEVAHAAWQRLRSGGSAHLGLWTGSKVELQPQRDRQQQQHHHHTGAQQPQQRVMGRGRPGPSAQVPSQVYVSHGQPQRHQQFAHEPRLQDTEAQQGRRFAAPAPGRAGLDLHGGHETQLQRPGVGPPARFGVGWQRRSEAQPYLERFRSNRAGDEHHDHHEHRGGYDTAGFGQRGEAVHQTHDSLMGDGSRRQQREQSSSRGFYAHDSGREAVNKARSAALRKLLEGARGPAEQQPARRQRQYHSAQ